MKNDGSPLTNADETSHAIISEELMKTGLPVLSEPEIGWRDGFRTIYNNLKYGLFKV